MPVDKKMNKPYCVNPEKVLIVKKFLDKGFSAHDYEKIGSNGLPCKIKVFSMNASNGEPLKYMYKDQLQDLLIDRFQNMFSDKIERELFMAQVIKDWVAGKIGIFGGLSTNRLLAENMTSEEIDDKCSTVNLNPTEAQKEAGNYAMGHVIVQGMPISIENPKGSKRFWKDEKGNEGHVIMKNHYGYFKKTSGNGKDGDAVDVFIGPNPEDAVMVYVVDQNNKSGEFDESKVMLGFKSITDAKEAYLSNYSKDWKGFREITGVGILTFKRWLYRKHKQRKPFADYVMIQKKKITESKLNDIIEESIIRILNEGLYDNFDPRDCDIIYYNHYQENWGDEDNEDDIENIYDILIYDMNHTIIYENEGLLGYELEDLLGEDIANMIINNEGGYNLNPALKNIYSFVLTDFNEHTFGDANEDARQIFRSQLCDYYPNLHGYIMQDGTCISLGYEDHNTICKIPQINDKWEFVALGNIRCSNSSFDLIQKPTMAQKRVLRKLIANSTDLTVDIFSSNKNVPLTSAIYYGESDPDFVLGQIDRFFNEGIKLKGNYH